MKLKDLMKKTGAIFMASAMLCTGAAAVLPLAVESGIVADAATYGDYEYKVLGSGTVEITHYNGNASSLSIPGSINGKKVTSIGADAFFDCTSLKSVTIPSGVTSIGEFAFFDCTSLKSVTIPSSVTSIGMDAFYNCTSLKSVTIPSSVKSIGEYAFNGCKGLADKNGFVIVKSILFDYFGNSANVIIPSGVTSIGMYAFVECTSLTSIKIPSSVKSIGASAFRDCTSLKSVTIPSSVTSIGEGAFADCASLTSIKIPSGVKSIGAYAFSDCTSLKSVTIPSSVKSIGEYAFYGCKGLADKNGFVIFGDTLCYYCGKSKNIVVPSSIKTVGGGAFSHNEYIESVTIPDSVTEIGDHVFMDCKNLKRVTLPKRVKSFGYGIFIYCEDLERVVLPEGINTIPGGKGGSTFFGCKKLLTVKIPDTVTSIGVTAFADCFSLKMIIPKTVKTIDYRALGYYFGDDGHHKIPGFTIYGTKGTAAEKYAKDNGFKFIAVTEPKSVSLNKAEMSLGVGETAKLSPKISPDNGCKTVMWRTSNSKIVTVDKNGNIKAVSNGTAWVTVNTLNGREASCKITVKNAPTKVTLTKGILTIGVGEKYSVNSGVNNGAAAAKRTYRTSNSKIVKMTRTDWQGEFVGVKPGVAYVTVRTYNGKESTCKVTVKAAPTSVTISKKTLTMKVGQTATLSCSVPSNAGCATRTFRSSNNNIVKMTKTNWTGSFKAMKPGTAYVTVRTYNGKESSCKITVVK